MHRQNETQKLVYSAFFLALAMILPFITGQIPKFGQMLLPMHLPVMLCGFLCGWPWGLAVGMISPVLRSSIFGTPIMFPMAIAMMFELAVKGGICGAVYNKLPKKNSSLYITVVVSMVISRIVYGCAQYLLLGMNTGISGLAALWTASVTTAVPGILLQLILIPFLVKAVTRKDWQKN